MNFKSIRKENKMTQTEVAKKINIDYTTLGRYENGISEPNLATLIKLADIYHTTTDNLLGHNVPYLLDTSTFSQEQNELIKEIKKLSSSNCKRVLDFITGIQIAEEEKQNIINLYTKGNKNG